MLEKDPYSYSVLTILFYAALASIGGFVKYAQDVLKGNKEFKPRNVLFWIRLLVEIFTSAFVGVVFYYACQGLDVSEPMTAAIVGVAGHQGANALEVLVIFSKKKFGLKE